MSMRGGKGYLEEWDLDQDGVAVRAASCFLDMNSFFACWRSGIRTEKILGVRIACTFIGPGVHTLLLFEPTSSVTVHGVRGQECLQSVHNLCSPSTVGSLWSER